jgi:hypothetical protein
MTRYTPSPLPAPPPIQCQSTMGDIMQIIERETALVWRNPRQHEAAARHPSASIEAAARRPPVRMTPIPRIAAGATVGFYWLGSSHARRLNNIMQT